MTMPRFFAALAAGGFLLGASLPAHATLQMQKDAKAAGLTNVQNCLSCHTDKMPKKGAAAVNEMGQWLVDKKAEKKADKIDVAWLKEYTPKKK